MNPYRLISLYNDYKALQKGPEAFAKRQVRKNVIRIGNKYINKALRKGGMY
jgi:hypothetical protein